MDTSRTDNGILHCAFCSRNATIVVQDREELEKASCSDCGPQLGYPTLRAILREKLDIPRSVEL